MTYPFSGQMTPEYLEYLKSLQNAGTQQQVAAANPVDFWNPNTGVFVPTPAPIQIPQVGNLDSTLTIIPTVDPAGTGKGIVPFSTLPYGYDIVKPTEDFPSGIAPRIGVNIQNPAIIQDDPLNKSPFSLLKLLGLLLMMKGGENQILGMMLFLSPDNGLGISFGGLTGQTEYNKTADINVPQNIGSGWLDRTMDYWYSTSKNPLGFNPLNWFKALGGPNWSPTS